MVGNWWLVEGVVSRKDEREGEDEILGLRMVTYHYTKVTS